MIEGDTVIFDIDNTLASIDWRRHHIKKSPPDWESFFDDSENDEPIKEAWRLAHDLALAGNNIILMTARFADQLELTMYWLYRNGFSEYTLSKYPNIYMRPNGDYRPDHEVKVDLLRQIKADGHKPWLAIEDRTRVVEALRKEGLYVLQCEDDDFEVDFLKKDQ